MSFQISPGVNTSEIDLTTRVPAVGTTTGCLVGPARWGEANVRSLVDSELTYLNEFWRPDNNCASTWFTISNFFSYSTACWFTRVVGPAAKNATADASGILIQNEDDYLNNYGGGQGAVGNWAARWAGDMGNSITVSMADKDSYGTWAYKTSFNGAPGTSPYVAKNGGLNDELHVVVVDSQGLWTGTKGSVLERYGYVSKSAVAKAADGSTIYYADVINRKSSKVWWMDHPVGSNWGDDAKTTYSTLATILALTAPSGSFTVGETVSYSTTVTLSSAPLTTAVATCPSGSVSGGVIATGTSSLTLSSGGTGYLSAPTVVFSGPGSGATATATVSGGIVTAINVTSGGTGYSTPPTISFTTPGTGATASATINGTTGKITAITVVAGGTGYPSGTRVVIAGPGTGATATTTVGSGIITAITLTAGGTGYLTKSGVVTDWSTPNLTIVPTAGAFADTDVVTGQTSAAHGVVNSVTGGAITDVLAGGVDDNANVTDGAIILGYDLYKSGDDVDISLVMSADHSVAVAEEIINICEFRKDCVAFLSPPLSTALNNAGHEAVDIVAYRDTLPESSYSIMDSGWKFQYDKYNDVYRWVPLNGDIAGLCVRTDVLRDAWWSPAGFNRGQIKNVIRLAWNPRQAYRDILYAGGVNPVITTTGEGTILYGDKTMLAKPSAFDRINVRRLFIVLEKAISTAAKYSLFEFNDKFTRASFVNMVEPFLRGVKGRRGIYDYRVVCDETNNTPEIIDGNQFVGDIYVKPARSINFIQLNFVAVRTGVAFDEIVGTF